MAEGLNSLRAKAHEGTCSSMADNVEVAPEGTEPQELLAGVLTSKIGPWLWCAILALAVAGCLGIFADLSLLWTIWTTDPLRSIGMLIPPVSIILTVRIWRQIGWELRGTWWGLLLIVLAFCATLLRQNALFFTVLGRAYIPFVPISIPIYAYASGVVLLFAGPRLWRKAWFPLGLLLFCKPVPEWFSDVVDIPLQNVSATVARAFATLIHFAPTTPQLRLMFSPDFGMFIAPGCDGIRGAITLGYVALVLGYIKRVSWRRWLAYVGGAVLLGYLFNFLRLCLLVLYYRVAIGHPALEALAKQADYAIGSCLFLTATVLFLWLALRRQVTPVSKEIEISHNRPSPRVQTIALKCAAFAAVVVATISMPSSALRYKPATPLVPESLAARMPKQIGNFVLTRTWYEQIGGTIVEEDGAYSAPGFDEVILGVWVAPLSHLHDFNWCWLARGLQPDTLTNQSFITAGGKSTLFGTGFYRDGVTDSIVVTAYCTSRSCTQFRSIGLLDRLKLDLLQPQVSDMITTADHLVTIMIRINKLRSDAPKSADYNQLSFEAQQFVSGFDPKALSSAFQ